MMQRVIDPMRGSAPSPLRAIATIIIALSFIIQKEAHDALDRS